MAANKSAFETMVAEHRKFFEDAQARIDAALAALDEREAEIAAKEQDVAQRQAAARQIFQQIDEAVAAHA